MSNAIVSLRYTLDLPESVVESIVGRPDDDSDEWRQEAFDKVEERCKDAGHDLLDYVVNDPDVDVDL